MAFAFLTNKTLSCNTKAFTITALHFLVCLCYQSVDDRVPTCGFYEQPTLRQPLWHIFSRL